MTTDAMLACVDAFAGTAPGEIEALARTVTRVRKAAGAALVREGQTGDALYVILRGRVNLVRHNASGRDLILSSLSAGDIVGEFVALDGMVATSTAIAAIPTEIARIPADALQAHLRRDPTTLARLLKSLTLKLEDVEAVASGLALCDVEERLRRTLVRLAKRQGRAAGAVDARVIAPMPTQSELARMVGSCRETVSRTLSAMARGGLLSTTGRRLVLNDALLATVGTGAMADHSAATAAASM
jgi:CRP-like cAMP-binding protein